MSQYTLIAGQPVELYALTGLPADERLAISVKAGVRVQVSTTNQFDVELEYVQPNSTDYTRDGLSEVWVLATQDTVIDVAQSGILTGDIFPDGVFTGKRALNVQFYPEANVKNGLQYYTRIAYPLSDEIASGTSKDIVVRTTSKKMLAKVRIVHYSAQEIEIDLFGGVTFNDQTGEQIIPSNYNGVNPVASTVEVFKEPTVSDPGTRIDDCDPEYYFGSNSQGQRSGESIPEGRERVLAANTSYLVRLTNTGTGDARVQYFLDWYEGEPDLPLIKP